MRSKVLIVGYGTQGKKRAAILRSDYDIFIVDPIEGDANAKDLSNVDLNQFEAAFICVPDKEKMALLSAVLEAIPRVLVEKPLNISEADVNKLTELCQVSDGKLYIAYNHRFEPALIDIKEAVSGEFAEEIYKIRLAYKNGTARNVRDSVWRDVGSGVFEDLGAHVFDILNFVFEPNFLEIEYADFRCFENNAPDDCLILARSGDTKIQIELSLVSWRNSFLLEIVSENLSLHVDGLCKWGPSQFIKRTRVLPSGKPIETKKCYEMSDPTWATEHDFFLKGMFCSLDVLAKNQLINEQFGLVLSQVSKEKL